MSGGSKFKSSMMAAFAALLVSSVAVGAAVGPAQASASPLFVAGSNLNA
jgi:hypothetical protein